MALVAETVVAISNLEVSPVKALSKGDNVLTFQSFVSGKPAGSTQRPLEFIAGTPAHEPQQALLIEYGTSQQLIVSLDQLFLQASGMLLSADNLVAGHSSLLSPAGEQLPVLDVNIGMYNNVFYALAASAEWNGSLDGHLLVANNVMIGDFTAQVHMQRG